MFRFIARRLLVAIPTLFLVITAAFFMMRAAPGGPFDSERRLPPEVERNVKAAYNLDKPLAQQYLIYLGKLARGDLGPSYKNKDFTVAQLIGNNAQTFREGADWTASGSWRLAALAASRGSRHRRANRKPKAKFTIPSAPKAPRQPMSKTRLGAKMAASTPPAGTPVCLTPIAVARSSLRNQLITPIVEAGLRKL